MLRIGQVERDVLASPVHHRRAYAGELVVWRELYRDRIAGARAARDGVGDLVAEVKPDAALVVGWVRDRPLRRGVNAFCIREHQRGHVRAVGKLGVADADPLQGGRQDWPPVIER